MADRYLLESGTPDGYLLEDGSGVLILQSTVYDAALFAPITQLVESYRNVRDRSLYQDGEKKVGQGSTGVGAAAPAGFDQATFPGIAQLSNSFRDVRVRSLYAGESDNLLAGPGVFDPFTMSGWIEPLGGFRSHTSIRYKRDTNIDTSWLKSSTDTVAFFPAVSQLSQSFRNVRNRSLYKSRQKKVSAGDGGGGREAAWDPSVGALSYWTIAQGQTRKWKYWTSDAPNVDWITVPVTAAAFDPATHPWAIQSDYPRKSRPIQMSWTKSGFFVTLYYNPALAGWTIDSQLVPGGPWWSSPSPTNEWIPEQYIAVLDPAKESFVIDSQRVPSDPYWTSQWQGNDWINPALLAEIAKDPAKSDWIIKTNTYKKRAWWTDSPQQHAWLVPSAAFDPKLLPATRIPSHRELPKAKGLWQPDLDNAWQFENPVIPNLFNASFVSNANIVEDAGGSPERSS